MRSYSTVVGDHSGSLRCGSSSASPPDANPVSLMRGIRSPTALELSWLNAAGWLNPTSSPISETETPSRSTREYPRQKDIYSKSKDNTLRSELLAVVCHCPLSLLRRCRNQFWHTAFEKDEERGLRKWPIIANQIKEPCLIRGSLQMDFFSLYLFQ